MARLYSDEGFPKKVSEKLTQLDHDVLTVQEAGQANQRIPDDQVLTYATDQNRAVLTINRADFIRLHRQSSDHAGIVVCTEDFNRERLANRVHKAISKESTLAGKLIRVNRPGKD
ncbi:DUF5615 family PIN-like protein [Leptolyngbya cf. ectocarpi LEGE 11479]|uniref:DUF5615 family PIN-like protein n=1 Tax=Leptolyngbya cf. ectocarpi LEGE 11479 TaxID=1828722 RepID=A0A928ZXF0_LEPEC|nr:DUF5615 family PIN-like protein [Leptolyngbya ectocarpi]MBE9069274.1 DUF5615 family PIN-like protein [Leptolyngbya cf. ectocarpi LEGE 11479]